MKIGTISMAAAMLLSASSLGHADTKPPSQITFVLYSVPDSAPKDLAKEMFEIRDHVRHNLRFVFLKFDPDSPTFIEAARDAVPRILLGDPLDDKTRQNLAIAAGATIYGVASEGSGGRGDIAITLLSADSNSMLWAWDGKSTDVASDMLSDELIKLTDGPKSSAQTTPNLTPVIESASPAPAVTTAPPPPAVPAPLPTIASPTPVLAPPIATKATPALPAPAVATVAPSVLPPPVTPPTNVTLPTIATTGPTSNTTPSSATKPAPTLPAPRATTVAPALVSPATTPALATVPPLATPADVPPITTTPSPAQTAPPLVTTAPSLPLPSVKETAPAQVPPIVSTVVPALPAPAVVNTAPMLIPPSATAIAPVIAAPITSSTAPALPAPRWPRSRHYCRRSLYPQSPPLWSRMLAVARRT